MTKTNKNKVDGMKKKPQMSYPQSCQLRAIHQIGGVPIAEIIRDKRRYPGFQIFSTATIYRHAKYPLDGTDVFDKRVLNKGRPSKLSEYDRRSIGRQVLKHMINVKLKKEALEKKITDESFEQFSERVKSTICNYPSKEIDKIIESMDKRVAMIIKAKGQRIRY